MQKTLFVILLCLCFSLHVLTQENEIFDKKAAGFIPAKNQIEQLNTKTPLYLPGFEIEAERAYDGTVNIVILNFGALNTQENGQGATPNESDVYLRGKETAYATVGSPAVGAGKDVTIHGLDLWGTNYANYELVLPSFTATITTTALTITADNKSKHYSNDAETDPALTVSYDGFVPGEGSTNLDGTPLLNRVAGEAVGTYTITISGYTSDNYDITFVNGTFSILPKPLEVYGLAVDDRRFDETDDATDLINIENVGFWGLVDEENVALDLSAASAEFLDPDIGAGKTVYIYNIGLKADDSDPSKTDHSGNYTLSSPPLPPGHGGGDDVEPPQFIGTATITQAAFAAIQLTGPEEVVAGETSEYFTITLKDEFGNVIIAENSKTFSLASSSTSEADAISLDTSVNIALDTSTATFTYMDQKAGTYTITATFSNGGKDNGTISATHSIVVTHAVADKLVFDQQPTDATAGVDINPAVTVRIKDEFGNLVKDADNSVTLTLQLNNGKESLPITSGFSEANSKPLIHDSVSSSGTPSISSVNSGTEPALQVGFVDAMPVSASSGHPVIVFHQQHLGGEPPRSATLTGTVTVAAVGGVATFDNISVEKVGEGYTLRATSVDLTEDTSEPFKITAAGADHIVLTGPESVVAGDESAAFTIMVYDVFGNVAVVSEETTFTLASDSGSEGDYVVFNPATAAIPSGQSSTTFTYIDKLAGEHTVTASFDSGDDGLTGESGTHQITVDPRPLTITVNSGTKVYGEEAGTYSFADFGGDLMDGDVMNDITGETVEYYAATTNATSQVGTYSEEIGIVTSSLNGDRVGSYDITVVRGALEITQRPLEITAASADKVYDGTALTNAGFSITEGALADGHILDAVTVTGSQTVVGSSDNVPSAAVITDGDSENVTANYDITYTDGTLEVTLRPLQITANDDSKTYGELYTFFSNEYTLTNSTSLADDQDLTLVLSSNGAPASAVVGDYDIIIGDVTIMDNGNDVTSNYDISAVSGTLTVGHATLTVTADDKTVTYGDAEPALTYTITGYVNEDTETALSGTPSLSTIYTTSTPVAESPVAIIITQDNLSADNYTFEFVDGVITIHKKSLVITAVDKGKVYGEALDLSTPVVDDDFTVSGLEGGDNVSSVTLESNGAEATAGVGTYSITASVATGNGLENYDITYNWGTLTVGHATLTVTADDKTVTYGDAVPELTYTITGYVNEEDESALSGSPALSTTYTTSTPVADSPVAITITQDDLSADNYTFEFVDGVITINKKSLVVTAVDKDKVYGDVLDLSSPQIIVDFTVTGLESGDEVESLTLASEGSEATANAGTYTVTISEATGTGLDNYDITYVYGELTVNKRSLQVTAVAEGITYGDTAPTVTVEYVGFVNDDNAEGLDHTGFDLGTNYTQGDPVGTYSTTIAMGTATDNNYEFTPLLDSGFVVSAKVLTITALPQSKTYGDLLDLDSPVLDTDYAVAGLKSGDAVSSVILASEGSAAMVDAGTYTVTISGATGEGLENYEITYVNGELTVDKRSLQVTAVAEGITYGDTAPTVTVEYDGFVNDDSADDLDNTGFTLGTTYTQGDAVGTYSTTISMGAATDNNYEFTPLLDSGFEVSAKVLTITALPQSKTYGETLDLGSPVLDTHYEVDGLKPGDAVSSVILASEGSAATVDAGTYTVTISGATGEGLENYDITYVNGELTVDKRSLQVTAVAEGITYGDTAPTVTVEYVGFVNDDNAEGLDNTGFDLGTNYTQGDPVGTYSTTIAMGTATDKNYEFTPLLDSGFEVSAKVLTITALPQSKTYGDLLDLGSLVLDTHYTVVGLESGDELTSVTLASEGAAETAGVATYTVTVSAAQGTGLDNYDITYEPGVLEVTPAELTITAASNLTKVYGTAYTFNQTDHNAGDFSVAGLLNADAITSVTLASDGAPVDAGVATYTVTVSAAQGTGLDNYDITYETGELEVTPAELTISSATANDKTYDATTDATISGAILNGVLNDDDVELDKLIGTFGSKDVGTNIPVTAQITLKGEHINNYTLKQPEGLTASITPKTLTISGSFAAKDKVYDENTDAEFETNELSLEGVENTDIDDVELSGVAISFNAAAVGTHTVTITAAELSGIASPNYTLSLDNAPETTATITAGPASQLVFVNEPPTETTAGTTPITFTVQVQDQFGNPTTDHEGFPNIATLAGEGDFGSFDPAEVTIAAGTTSITFNWNPPTTAGTYTITLSTGTEDDIEDVEHVITIKSAAPSPDHITITANPTTLTLQEVETATISVQLFDQFNNIVDEGQHTIALTATPALGTFSAVEYTGAGVYSASFTPHTPGLASITATINEEDIADDATVQIIGSYIFTGEGNDADWDNGANWNTPEPPDQPIAFEVIIEAMAEADDISIGEGGSITVEEGGSLNTGDLLVGTGTLTIASGGTAGTASLTIADGGKLTIGAHAELTVEGTLTNNAGTSGILIQSIGTGTGTFTGSLLHSSEDVEATVELFIRGNPNDWHMLSSPMTAQPIAGDAPSDFHDGAFFGWHEPMQSWVNFNNHTHHPTWSNVNNVNGVTSTFHPGKGYLIAYGFEAGHNPTKVFSGKLNQGEVKRALMRYAHDEDKYVGFNLVGNPYPSAIDWKAAEGWIGREYLENYEEGYNMWIWNEDYENYGAFNTTIEGSFPDGSPYSLNGVSQYIPAMQAFWVRAAEEYGGESTHGKSFGMDNRVRVHSSDQSWLKDEPAFVSTLHLSVGMESEHWRDEVLVQFGHQGDRGGAQKMFSMNPQAPGLYTVKHDAKYTISFLTNTEEHRTVPLGFRAGRTDNYNITISGINTFFEEVWLVDLLTGKEIRLWEDQSYDFSAKASDSPDRFVLRFGAPDDDDITDVEEPGITEAHIYYYDDMLHVANPWAATAEVQVFDIRANVVKTFDVQAHSITQQWFARDSGVYVVRMQSGKHSHVTRIVVAR